MSLSKPTPTWAGLPTPFKRELLEKLDYKSRCRLARCSTAERDLVYGCPVLLRFASITPPSNEEKATLHFNGYIPIQFFMLKTKQIVLETYDRERAIADFFLVFRHNKSEVESVSLGDAWPMNASFVEKMMIEARKYGDNFKAKMQGLSWFCDQSEEEFKKFLDIVDANVLKVIVIKSGTMGNWNMEPIFNTDHWRNAKEICLDGPAHISLLQFSHLNMFEVTVLEFNADEVSSIIQNYLRSDKPLESCFKIRFQYCAPSIEDTYEIIKFPILSQRNDNCNNYWTTQYHLGMRNREHVLIVKVHYPTLILPGGVFKMQVTGVVCRRMHIEEDSQLKFTWR